MAKPTGKEIAYAGAMLAAAALDKAADADPRHLAAGFLAWFPDADGSMQREEMARIVADQLRGHAILIRQRQERLVAKGAMRPPAVTRAEAT
jgi:hypothetical protein